jgi:hypothetical protein
MYMKYRKKPVEIEAYQIKQHMTVETLEGVMTGEPGDWLIFGVEGEAYFCKDSIFRKTYEPAEGVVQIEPILILERGSDIQVMNPNFPGIVEPTTGPSSDNSPWWGINHPETGEPIGPKFEGCNIDEAVDTRAFWDTDLSKKV